MLYLEPMSTQRLKEILLLMVSVIIRWMPHVNAVVTFEEVYIQIYIYTRMICPAMVSFIVKPALVTTSIKLQSSLL